MRARYPDEQGHVENDGVRIFYELYENDAPTMLLMPPVAFSHSRIWKGAVPFLSRHFRVLTFDGRGNGNSDRPSHASAYGPEQFVADALSVMNDTATERAIVTALGPRAICGVRLAVDHPERVAGLALLAPDLFTEREFAEAWRAVPEERHSGFAAFNPQLMRTDWPAFLEAWSRVMFPHPHSSRQIEDMIAYGLETDGETFVASTVGIGYPPRETVLELAARLRCPRVVTQWGHPMWPARTSDSFAAASGSPLVVFDGLGPAVSSRWPVATNLLLREFADSIRDGREPCYERWNQSGMHLVGQHSDPSELLEAVLGSVPGASCTRRTEPAVALSEAKRLGNGVVQRALIRALTVSDGPMGVREAQAAIEALLGHSDSRDSVNSCLSTGARGVRPGFERVAPGRYRLARDP